MSSHSEKSLYNERSATRAETERIQVEMYSTTRRIPQSRLQTSIIILQLMRTRDGLKAFAQMTKGF